MAKVRSTVNHQRFVDEAEGQVRCFVVNLDGGVTFSIPGNKRHSEVTLSGEEVNSFVQFDKSSLKAARDLIERVASLNPDAGEIGAGMLANLVASARKIVGKP